MSPGFRPSFDLGAAHEVTLAGRGSTTVWDSSPNAANDQSVDPPTLLLHGWNVDAPTNYGYSFSKLSSAGRRVVMYDQHGHGHGPRRDDPFSMSAAADDAAAVLDALDIAEAVVVGYSMGGAVGQTMLRNHPDRCAGIVLSATAGYFSDSRREATQFATMARGARLLRRLPPKRRDRAFEGILRRATSKYPEWIAEVVQRADPISLLEAGASLGSFDSRDWMNSTTVPSAFVVTARDTIVPMSRQVELATAMEVDALHSVAAGHEVPILNDDNFNTALAEAVDAVTAKISEVRNHSAGEASS